MCVFVDQFHVNHPVSRFSVRKNVPKNRKKERKKESNNWIDCDISGPGNVSFLSGSSIDYSMLILHVPINLLNVISANSFSCASNFASLTTWSTNDLGRLQLLRINNSDKKLIRSLFPFVKRKKIRSFSFEFTNQKIT